MFCPARKNPQNRGLHFCYAKLGMTSAHPGTESAQFH